MKKILSYLLTLALVLSCVSGLSLQASAATVASGTCGDTLTWTLDDAGTLTISGTGEMYDYGFTWYDYWEDIQKVVIKSGVTTIGECAFRDCYSVTDVTIPASVTSIGMEAFYWCESLTSVTIPKSVTYIGDYAFDYCMNLEGIWVDEENPAYSSDESGVLFNKDKTLLIKAPGALAGAYTVPDGVITIQDWAFECCFNLTSVSFPKSLLTFGSYAFDGCHGLEKFWVDEQNPVYSSDEKGVVFNKEKTVLVKAPNFLPGEYTVPAGITEIAPNAFNGNNELMHVILQPGVEKIGEGAFFWCGSLTSVTIPNTVTEIERGAFAWSESLLDVYYGDTREQWEQILIGQENGCLLNANIHYAGESTPGDLDGTEAVDEDDVIYLLQHLLMPGDFEVNQSVDYDKSGAVDEDDVIYLLQHLLMPEDFPLTDGGEEEEPQKVMTHAEYMAAPMDSYVTVECYVQAHQSWWDDQIVIYAQDHDGAYLLYGIACAEEDADRLTEGTKIRVSGYKAEWCGLVEIKEGTFEFVEDGDTFIAAPRDVTGLLGTEQLIQHQNEKVAFKGMTVVASNEEGDAFLYKWDGSGEPGDDLYFNASLNGEEVYTFCIERYLTEDGTDVYEAVESLKVGDVIDMEGFLYWYYGPEAHITSVTVVS